MQQSLRQLAQRNIVVTDYNSVTCRTLMHAGNGTYGVRRLLAATQMPLSTYLLNVPASRHPSVGATGGTFRSRPHMNASSHHPPASMVTTPPPLGVPTPLWTPPEDHSSPPASEGRLFAVHERNASRAESHTVGVRDTATMVGVVVGSVAGLVLVVLCVFLACRTVRVGVAEPRPLVMEVNRGGGMDGALRQRRVWGGDGRKQLRL